MSALPVGQILAIAVRTAKEGPMREVAKATASEGAGIEGDQPSRSHRGITLISAADWRQTMSELDASLPWHTRRANVLVEGLTMADLIGHTVRFGQITLQIGAETRPCELMDRLHAGLWNALKPNCRAGVYGKVLTGGEFAVGDHIEIEIVA
jgi:MOSC domain-containing protein YiiM